MLLIRNATALDPASGNLTENASVVVEGERIREVSAGPIKVSATLTLDAGGRTVMPGLIDSHVHVFLSEVNIRALEAIPLTLMTARGAGLMRAMLDRGLHHRARHRRRRLGHP
jgi:imidazolonepropionase-like amidohydrolase